MQKSQLSHNFQSHLSANDFSSKKLDNGIQQNLPKELGHGKTEIIEIEQGLNYLDTQFRPVKDLIIKNKIENHSPQLIVTVALKGSSSFLAKKESECVFNQGYTTITAVKSSIGQRQYQANKATRQLRFVLSENWLKKYFTSINCSQLFKTTGLNILSHQPISHQAMLAAQQLIQSNTQNPLNNKLSLHSHSLSILAAELSLLNIDSQEKTTKPHTPQDINSLAKARNILENEFKSPPTVAKLAHRAGINQFKLKQLFHYYYNTTPYAFLHDIRMKTAYTLLESKTSHINEIAYFVGYQHASNFSSAFVKYFGLSPKYISKK